MSHVTVSTRIDATLERELAKYCRRSSSTRSAVVRKALQRLLSGSSGRLNSYDLIRDLIGPHTDEHPLEDVAIHTKRLLRERIRVRPKMIARQKR